MFKQNNDVDAFNFHEDMVPDTQEELDPYMKLHYKQGIEVAQETAITNILEYNDYEETKRRLDEDQAVWVYVAKHQFDTHDGIRIEYVDPVDFVYSPTKTHRLEIVTTSEK